MSFFQVVHIISSHHRHAHLFCQLVDVVITPFLGNVMILDLQVVIIAEHFPVAVHHFDGALLIAAVEMRENLAAHAGGKHDQAFAVLLQRFPVDPRLIIEAVDKGGAGELHQILVAAVVLGQQHQVIGGTAVDPGGLPVCARAGGHVGFHPDDRFDPCTLARLVKLQRTEHIAVIGDRQGRHLVFHGFGNHLLDLVGPIQQAIFGMIMQVDV